VNFAGTWSITTTNNANTCGDPTGVPESFNITVTQTGSSITVVTDLPGVGPFSGTVSGNSVSWSGSYPESGGTTTITSLTATVSGNSLSGSSNWSWTDGIDSCSGSDTFTGTRTSGGTINEVEPNDTPTTPQVVPFPATIAGSTIGDILDNNPPVDFDGFEFTLASAQTITITLSGGTTQDMDLYLFDSPVTTQLAASEGLDSNESITISLGAGTYIALVSPFQVTATTSYTLSIQ
jgi:hypothetical protein